METKDNLEMAQSTTNVTSPSVDPVAEQSTDAASKDVGTHQEHIKEALELLYVHFPKAFIKEGDCKPLKIGILEDLKVRIAGIEGLSISKVRAAVRVYTTRLRYFYSVREGAKRVDLDGQEIDSVTAEHAEYARTRFNEINSKRQANKPKVQSKPQPHRNRHGQRPNDKRGAGHAHAGDNRNGGGQNRRFNQQGNGFNRNRNFRNDSKRYEPAKESDLKVGRYVFVSLERNSYTRGTVSELLRGEAKVTLQNGLSVTIPTNSLFVQSANNNRGGDNRSNRPRGHINNRQNDRSRQRHDHAPKGAGTVHEANASPVAKAQA